MKKTLVIALLSILLISTAQAQASTDYAKRHHKVRACSSCCRSARYVQPYRPVVYYNNGASTVQVYSNVHGVGYMTPTYNNYRVGSTVFRAVYPTNSVYTRF